MIIRKGIDHRNLITDEEDEKELLEEIPDFWTGPDSLWSTFVKIENDLEDIGRYVYDETSAGKIHKKSSAGRYPGASRDTFRSGNYYSGRSFQKGGGNRNYQSNCRGRR